jgi:PhzF family phenazine biosynthesis protein
MNIALYQVDAFTDRLFHGNPAAVCPLKSWPADELLQAIAAENNLSETAFMVKTGADYELRWFTPLKEVELCGHATLAAALVVFESLGHPEPQVHFHTRKSGTLTVYREELGLSMNFPARPATSRKAPVHLQRGLGVPISQAWFADDWMVVLDDASLVRTLQPDMAQLALLEGRGVIITAPGQGDVDFVSRFFAPKYGIPEDPVTGSAHCTLAPYWAERLGKATLKAKQVSRRGGELVCHMEADRVWLSGQAVLFLEGRLTL